MNTVNENGLFIQKIKCGKDEGWALFLFKTEENVTYRVYMTKNFPNLRMRYKVTLNQNDKGSWTLNSFTPIIEVREINWEDQFTKIPNIGKLSAAKLNKAFGKDIFRMVDDLEKYKEKLLEVIKESQIESIKMYYDEKRDLINGLIGSEKNSQSHLEFFYANSLQETILPILDKIHEGQDINYVTYYKTNNPYILIIDEHIGFMEIVDRFALSLGWKNDCFYRYEAYFLNRMKFYENYNSTLIRIDVVMKDVQDFFQDLNQDIENEYINLMLQNGSLTLTDQENLKITRTALLNKEKFIAKKLLNIQKNKPTISLTSETNSQLHALTPLQKRAYSNFINENVSIISGGPGTGKTFIIKHIFDTLKSNKLKSEVDYAILAPTGRAATNIASKSKAKVKTIHSLLQIKDTKTAVPYDVYDKLKDLKILVIDEFSMVDVNLLEKLLKTCPSVEKIVLIGDKDQLPAIGPGDLLNDLINSEKFPTVKFEEFFRSDSQTIWKHFSSIKNKKMPEFEKGVVDLVVSNQQTFKEDILNIFEKKVEKYDIKNTMLICPVNKGELGLDKLNPLIQERINPDGKVIYESNRKTQKITFKIGDKVMQLENRIADDICNGDIGFIKDVIYSNKKTKDNKQQIDKIIVSYERPDAPNKEISYTKNEFEREVKLSYGSTVHKFQGSEIASVIFVVHPDYSGMLKQNLMYTATSRAIKNLTIITISPEFYIQKCLDVDKTNNKIETNLRKFLVD
ncbi:AAA family ATPase [Mycoplasma nasistruthionis]|uniref:AAA family ATPase n=1 Tax=Mycoplasma nasistruthionis TaxID=353852 RepID=A0A4Y6I6L7_9MOLU|nr:AAA family ATPase [Mycoplasma nasistruthionis]QDF65163.1 hypothetical protein FIV53_02605 [Mycoplasma nasistruthionis]